MLQCNFELGGFDYSYLHSFIAFPEKMVQVGHPSLQECSLLSLGTISSIEVLWIVTRIKEPKAPVLILI